MKDNLEIHKESLSYIQDKKEYLKNRQPTTQELYDNLIEEGKQVFEEFRNELAKAASPYTILGTTPNELKQLTQAMLDAKSRILNELDTHLANNDLDKLKSFTYQTQEAQQLKSAIENFK